MEERTGSFDNSVADSGWRFCLGDGALILGKSHLSARSSAAFMAQWLQSFREFPPRQKPASFSLDQVMQQISRPQNGDN
jgi:hypothetical protein